MLKIKKTKVSTGIYYVEIPKMDIRILCGSPADSVKHLIKQGHIASIEKNGVNFETGPNVILLSDVLIQNGDFANLSEFPVLQMLYKQCMIIPNHPNNTGQKPLIIGAKEQIESQLKYIYRGNYGLVSEEEIIKTGISPKVAKDMMRMKLKFAFGQIKDTKELLEYKYIENNEIEIKDNLFIKRISCNIFKIRYNDEVVTINLNLENDEKYKPVYYLGAYNIERGYFSVIHSGQGDGWDINHPSMSSILIFQGKIYLIDAGPNIIYTLNALGMDINEIEGIFHTHLHDDHFAGLPALLQTDHKIKYYATALIRASVMKKLSVLLSMNEDDLSQYFEIHDLEFEKWNNIQGLDVKPIFSPHPVETNIFIFRSLYKNHYATYGHFADIIGLDILKNMITDDENNNGIRKRFYEKIRKTYLTPLNLKKIDIGAGMIHGYAEDFTNNKDSKIVFAHTSVELTTKQKEIGSGAPFGIVDILIPNYQDFLMRDTYSYLNSYLPNIPSYKMRTLMNNPIVTFNPTTIILKEGEVNKNVYLILTGTVEVFQSNFNINNRLSAGGLIGDISDIVMTKSIRTYRSLNYVQTIEIPNDLYIKFLHQVDAHSKVEILQEKRDFFKRSELFSKGLSHLVQNKIAQNIIEVHYKKDSIISEENNRYFYILKNGKIAKTINNHSYKILNDGDFFLEEQVIFNAPFIFSYKALEDSVVYKIDVDIIKNIPILNWKLLESYEATKVDVLNKKSIYDF